jgi:hypothetical protein
MEQKEGKVESTLTVSFFFFLEGKQSQGNEPPS